MEPYGDGGHRIKAARVFLGCDSLRATKRMTRTGQNQEKQVGTCTRQECTALGRRGPANPGARLKNPALVIGLSSQDLLSGRTSYKPHTGAYGVQQVYKEGNRTKEELGGNPSPKGSHLVDYFYLVGQNIV